MRPERRLRGRDGVGAGIRTLTKRVGLANGGEGESRRESGKSRGCRGQGPRKIQSLGNCLGEITGGLRLNEQFLLIEHSQFVEAKPNAPFSVAA